MASGGASGSAEADDAGVPGAPTGAPAPSIDADHSASASAELLSLPAWAPIRRDLQRRDSTALRVMLGRELDHVFAPDGSTVDVDYLLRLWARFSQAVYDEKVDGLTEDPGVAAPDSGEEIDWNVAVGTVFARLLAGFPAADTPEGARCRATFGVFVYAETLVFWEHSVVTAEVEAIRRALAALAEEMPTLDEGAVRCRDVVLLAADLLACIGRQLRVESAMAACALQAIEVRAGAARDALTAAEGRARTLLRDLRGAGEAPPVDPGLTEHLAAMLALVLDDLSGTTPYFGLLADQIAPASRAFLANLTERTDDDETAERLRLAAERCREFEDSPVGRWSVFATEVRAHRVPLEAAARHCARPDFAHLELIKADVTYLYPFGLPVAATGTDVLPELMSALGRAGEGEEPPIETLAGVRIVIDDAPRSDGWLASTSIQDRDYRAFRAVFPDHQLMLRTADGGTIAGLDVDVRLSGMGNHYVRVRAGTDSHSEGGPEVGAWNAHDLEQAIRRGGQFAGTEAVWFRARTPGSSDSAEFGSLLELATAIVKDLATAAHDHVRAQAHAHADPAGDVGPAAGDDHEDLSRDLDIAEGFLARYGQVLVTIGRADAVSRNGARHPLVEVGDLDGVVGVQTALTAQRTLSQSALEWVTYPVPNETTRARRALVGQVRREFIWCSGDVTTIFCPTAPNWQALVTQSLVEFCSSLIGVFWRRQQWLRRVVDEAGLLLAPPAPGTAGASAEAAADAESPAPEWPLARVEAMEKRLTEAVRHVQLLVDRANEHTLSKDQQGREISQHLVELNGVAELQRSLGATVQAAISTQRFLQERIVSLRDERREDAAKARQRPLEFLVAVLAVLGLIDLFGWFNDTWGLAGDRRFFFAELSVIAVVAVVVWLLSRRAWTLEESPRRLGWRRAFHALRRRLRAPWQRLRLWFRRPPVTPSDEPASAGGQERDL